MGSGVLSYNRKQFKPTPVSGADGAVQEVFSSALDALSGLGVDVKPKKMIGIYGPSMVGKSVFASLLAKEYVGDEGLAVVYGTEDHYADEDYKSMISAHLPSNSYVNYCANVQELFRYMSILRHKNVEGRVAVILDSLSFIAMREQSILIARGVTEPRVISARVVPVLYAVASQFKNLVVEKGALGIIVMHAASTAGTGKFRGITTLKPSMAMRVAHSLDYLVLMTAEDSRLDKPRTLTLVASRLSPGKEGRTVKFVFKQSVVASGSEK